MTTEIATTQNEQNQQKKETTNTNANTSNTTSSSAVVLSREKDADIKFPLEDSWSFWFYKNEKSKSWKENVKFITTVEFVEDFWGSIFF